MPCAGPIHLQSQGIPPWSRPPSLSAAQGAERGEGCAIIILPNTLVNLSSLLARACDFDRVAEGRYDEHLDRFRKHRPADDDAWFQFNCVHLTPPRPPLLHAKTLARKESPYSYIMS